MALAAKELFDSRRVQRRDQPLGLAQHAPPRDAIGQHLPSSSACRSTPLATSSQGSMVPGPKRVTCSPSVSISATSMPSSEVPLISPIVRISRCTPYRMSHSPCLNPLPDLLNHAASSVIPAKAGI
jgi:hypothetical protein